MLCETFRKYSKIIEILEDEGEKDSRKILEAATKDSTGFPKQKKKIPARSQGIVKVEGFVCFLGLVRDSKDCDLWIPTPPIDSRRILPR